MGRIGRQIAGAVVVAGVAGLAGRLGPAMFKRVVAHHNELFVGQGSVWYDRLAPHLLGGFYRRVADEVAAMQRTGTVLDVGCGPGHLALALARRAPDLMVQGADLSGDMVQRATDNAAHAGLAGRVRFDVSGAASLPYADASVDLAVSTLSMHHWTDVAGMLRELARVVRPGGQVWIYDVWRPAMVAAVEAAALELPFAAPRVEPISLRLGVFPLRHAARRTLVRTAGV
jgi:ubiquinone/menaquinone biosynthesis C-methylase UbiE